MAPANEAAAAAAAEAGAAGAAAAAGAASVEAVIDGLLADQSSFNFRLRADAMHAVLFDVPWLDSKNKRGLLRQLLTCPKPELWEGVKSVIHEMFWLGFYEKRSLLCRLGECQGAEAWAEELEKTKAEG
jgi:hypothetical protein